MYKQESVESRQRHTQLSSNPHYNLNMGASKPLPSTAYPTLAPSIKHISQSTIRKKWKPLPQQSQDKIRQILLNIRTKRSGHGGGGRITAPSKRPRARNGEGKLSKSAIAEEEYEKVVQEVSNKYATCPSLSFLGPSNEIQAPLSPPTHALPTWPQLYHHRPRRFRPLLHPSPHIDAASTTYSHDTIITPPPPTDPA